MASMKRRSAFLTIRLKLLAAFGTCVALSLLTGAVAAISFIRTGAQASTAERWLVAGAIVLALTQFVVAACFGIHLVRVICGGLDRMGRRFEEISESLDLSKRSSAPCMDEFGRSAVAFDRLMQRIEHAVSEVRASSEAVTTATREIAAGNIDLSARTEEQAASLEETAASMAQMIESLKRNADSASQAREFAASAIQVTQSGAELMEVMVEAIRAGSQQASRASAAMGDIRVAIARVSGIVGEIAQASDEQSRGVEQIGQAVNQIDDVTQHNAALVEQAAAATQSLDEQADRLKAAVASFKLSGATPCAAA